MSRLLTPKAILSYPHLFTPQKGMNAGDKEKYSAAFVFTPEEQKTPEYAAMIAAIKEVGEAKFGSKFLELVRAGKLKSPIRTDEKPGYPAGSTYINARSDAQPGIVGREVDPSTGKARIITDAKEIYAGIIVRAKVSAFAYDQPMNKGVSFGLTNLQKLADGARLDGRSAAEDDFEADLGAEPASIDDLT